MTSRHLALALALATSASGLVPAAASAHWCDDLWVANYNFVIRPVTDSVIVPASGSATLDIYVQNNMGYPLKDFELNATAGAKYLVTVSHALPKYQNFLMPGEKLKHTLTFTPMSGGGNVSIADISFGVRFGDEGQGGIGANTWPSHYYPSGNGEVAMIRKRDGTLIPAKPIPGITTPNSIIKVDNQSAHLLFSSQADYDDLDDALDRLMKQYCVGRGGWNSSSFTGPTTGLCENPRDASTYVCPALETDPYGSRFEWQRLWSAQELAYRKSRLGDARLAALRKGLQCGWKDVNLGFKYFAAFVLGYLGEDATARSFLEGIISSGTAQEKAVAKASLLLMRNASDSATHHAAVVTCASDANSYVSSVCQASLGIVDKNDDVVSKQLIPKAQWQEPSGADNGKSFVASHLLALVSWDRRGWAPNAGDTGQVCFYENCGSTDTTPPAAPGTISCSATAGGNIRIRWPEVTLDEKGQLETGVSYKVYYGTSARPASASTPNDFPYDHADATTGTYRDYTGLDGTKTFYFSVVAVDAAGLVSKYSNETSCAPAYSPVAALVCNSLTGTAPLDVSCSAASSTDKNGAGDIASYAFKLDGATVSATTPPSTFATRLDAGGHIVQVTVTDKTGLSGTATANIAVTSSNGNQPPVARAAGNPVTGRAPLTVAFSSASSSDPEDGAGVSFQWAFGDGQTSTEPNPTHTYQLAGTYGAVLTVTDSGGLKATAEVAIVVTSTNNPPSLDTASLSPTSGPAPLTVAFDGSHIEDPDHDPFTLTWDFDDGSPTDHSASPSHTYTAPGTYDATLTVQDNGAPAIAAVTKTFRITATSSQGGDPPNCSLATVEPTTGVAPLTVTLDASKCTPPQGIAVSWQSGANQVSSSAAARYTFEAPGEYTIDLRVTANGQVTTRHFSIAVTPPMTGALSPFACATGGGGLFLAGGALALLPFLRRRRSSRAPGMLAASLLAAASLVAAAPAQAKDAPGDIALLPVRPGPGAKPPLATRATELLAQRLASDLPFSTVIKPADVARAVGRAKARKLAACAEARCLSEVAKATHADAVVFGSLARAGKSLALTLSVFENRKISRRSRQPLASQSEDALYGALGDALKKLFPAPPPPPPPPAPVAEALTPEPEPEPAPAAPPSAPETLEETGVSASAERDQPPGPVHVDARLQIEPSLDPFGLAGMAGFVGVGYAVTPSLAVEIGGIVASSYGTELRLSWAPIDITSDGSLRALIRLEAAGILFKPPTGATATGGITLFDRLALFGAGASVGIEYAPLRALAFGVEVPVLYLFNAPQLNTANGPMQVSRFFLFVGPFVTLRL